MSRSGAYRPESHQPETTASTGDPAVPLEARRMLSAVGTVLLVALAYFIGGQDELVAYAMLGFLALIVAVLAVRVRFGFHVVRVRDGWLAIYNRRVPGRGIVRVMRQGGVYQSATYLDERRFEPVFAYQRAFDAVLEAVPGSGAGAASAVEDGAHRAGSGPVRTVLALGGGGYAWPKHALTAYPDLKVDVVELDPAVTAVARRWFFVDELAARVGAAEGSCVGVHARLGLITGDARDYLAQPCLPRYDAVINDVFSGHEPVRALATVEAARAVKAALAPGGRYAVNVVSRAAGGDLGFLRDVVATLNEVFAHVQVVPAEDDTFGGEDNYLVIASDAEISRSDAIPYDEAFLGTPLHDRDV